MFKPLSRDYWPAEVTMPLLRTGGAFLFAPVFGVALFLLLMFGVDVAFSSDASMATSRAVGVAPYLMAGTCSILWTAGVIAFLLLWSLRKHGRRHYLLAGVVVGLIMALALPIVGEQPRDADPDATISVVSVVVMTIYFGLMLIIVRWLSGVRRLNG